MPQNIKVVVRVRPTLETESSSNPDLRVDVANNRIILHDSPYIFDSVADVDTSQQHMYCQHCIPMLDHIFSGYNATIFAYGQTGSGKTYTMNGPQQNDNPQTQGIIPRIFNDIFSRIHHEQQHRNEAGKDQIEYTIKLSCIEIYNNKIKDLLARNAAPCALHKWTQLTCTDKHICLGVVSKAAHRRSSACTAMNDYSSRSHLIVSIVMTRRTMLSSNSTDAHIHSNKDRMVKSQSVTLNLVDLAGSERQSKTNATGQRFKEARHINTSLSTLSRVIRQLEQKQQHISYRDSELTRVLQQALGGNSYTMMIGNVSPSIRNQAETRCTLEFAKRLKKIRTKAAINEHTFSSLESLKAEHSRFAKQIEELLQEKERLQQENENLKVKLMDQEELQAKMEQTRQQMKEREHAFLNERQHLQQQIDSQQREIEQLKAIQAQQEQDTDVKMNVDVNHNENDNESENISGLCACDPWVLLESDKENECNTARDQSIGVNTTSDASSGDNNIHAANMDSGGTEKNEEMQERKENEQDDEQQANDDQIEEEEEDRPQWISKYLKNLKKKKWRHFLKLLHEEIRWTLTEIEWQKVQKHISHKIQNQIGRDQLNHFQLMELIELEEQLKLEDATNTRFLQKERLEKEREQRCERIATLCKRKSDGDIYEQHFDEYAVLLGCMDLGPQQRKQKVQQAMDRIWARTRKRTLQKVSGTNLLYG